MDESFSDIYIVITVTRIHVMGVVHTSRGVLSRGWRFVLLTNLVVDTTHPGTATIRFKGGAGAKAPTLPRRIPPNALLIPSTSVTISIRVNPRFSLDLRSELTHHVSFVRSESKLL